MSPKKATALTSWWPPKVGTTLRHSTRHGAGAGRTKQVDALLHVLSVFKDKDGEMRIVTAEWFPTKRRWNYEVMSVSAASAGLIWPAGSKKPESPWA